MQAWTTTERIEISNLSYHGCPWIRSRIAVRTKSYGDIIKLSGDLTSMVLINVLDNPLCTRLQVEQIAIRTISYVEEADKFKNVAVYWANLWRVLVIHTDVPWESRKKIESFLVKWDAKPPRPVVGFITNERNALLTLQKPIKEKGHLGVLTTLGWQTYAKHWSPKVRRAVIARKDCPDEIVRSFLKDPNWFVYLKAWYKLIVQKIP